MTGTSLVFDLADRYVTAVAELDPIAATHLGVPGHDHELPDYSPVGTRAQARLAESTLAELASLVESAGSLTDDDRVAALSMRERLGSLIDMDNAGDSLRRLSVLGCPAQEIRAAFDLMSVDTPEQRHTSAARMRAVPGALNSWRASLSAGIEAGVVASRRQAIAVAGQCDAFAGTNDEGGWFSARVATMGEAAGLIDDEWSAAATLAEDAYRDMGAWLRGEYAASADEVDGVGPERYGRMARAWNGASLDLLDTFNWGWRELKRITTRMDLVAQRLLPGRARWQR